MHNNLYSTLGLRGSRMERFTNKQDIYQDIYQDIRGTEEKSLCGICFLSDVTF